MPTKEELLAGLPEPLPLTPQDVLTERGPDARQLVVIDDHPSGSQSMADIPVLTAWSEDQVEWALAQAAPAVYVVTNTRALSPAAAEDRYVEVITAFLEGAERLHTDVRFVLRSDSSLRGHYPLDVDILSNALESTLSRVVDGVVMVPAFPEAGRITVHGVHHVAEHAGSYVPVGQTRYAQEPRFPFASSDLREWVAEKTRGRCPADSVLAVDLEVVRQSPDAVAAQVMNARRGQAVVIDAASEEDLRSIAIGLLRVEATGRRLVYRVGPPMVRAMIGQPVHAALTAEEIEGMRVRAGTAEARTGLVVVGTPVPFTRRQLRVLTRRHPVREIPISVPAVLDSRRSGHIEEVVAHAVEALDAGNVVVRLADMHVDLEAKGDFSIDPRVGRAVNEVVHRIAKARRLKFVVARGGSVTSVVAQGLGVRRAMVRGPVLEGIVSLWEPLVGPLTGVPFVVYAGGVGDDDGLADVVDTLSGVQLPSGDRRGVAAPPPAVAVTDAGAVVIGLGSKGLPIAARLAERFPVRAWDIDPRRRELAAHEGVSAAVSARDAIAEAATVLVAVRGETELDEVLFGDHGIAGELPRGAVVGVLMAVGVREIRAVARRLAARGVHTVDMPISGSGERARTGELTVLVGGPDEAVGTVRPLLEHLAATVVHVGQNVGDGQAMKAVNQLLVGVTLAGVAEALALGAALGLDPALTLRALGSGAASSYVMLDRGPRMVEVSEGITPQLVNRIDITAGDLGVALEVAREEGLPTPVAAAVEQVLLRAVRALPPDADDAALIAVVTQD